MCTSNLRRWLLAAGAILLCGTAFAQEPVRVTVSPANVSINVGAASNFSASAVDSSGLPVPGIVYTWSSSDPAVASINTTGRVQGLTPGNTTITATAPNGVFGTASLRVAAVVFPPPSDFRIGEIHYDNVGVDAGEALEVEGPAGTSMAGYLVVLYNGNGGAPYNTVTLAGMLTASCGTRGVMAVTYPQDGIQNGSPDGVAIISPSGVVLEFMSYEGVFTATSGPAAGFTSRDIGIAQNGAPIGTSLQRDSLGVWTSDTSTFGECNPEPPPPVGNSLSFSGRELSDPALPVGFEDQLFATLRDPSNVTIPTTITWNSDTPAIATIDANGVMRALAEGTAIIRATATDGTTATYSLPTRVPVASTTALYAGNAEFGEPTDADPSDDFIVRHEQYTASYNRNRGAPNWVAYDLDATHFGAEDRCDCFTADPSLPADFPRLTTNDYTGSGAIAGFGIDRGHLARSFDRTSASLDNARTFFFDNIIPQAADQNQGPWAALEADLGDLARVQDREVYIIAGAFGNQGTLKNEGRVVIPTFTWKVALILPRDQGLGSIRDYRDVEAIAVLMPNQPGVRDVPWQDYLTTVDQIEAQSGYDLLALLADDVEAAVESNTQPPLATATGPINALAEGGTASFSAAGSLDPNGTIASFSWDFGDGGAATGETVTHVYAQDGTYTARLTITDNDGLTDTATMVVNVTNVVPVVNTVPNASVNVGVAYTVSGTFQDPGADAWTATVNWGDGSAPSSVALGGRSFTLTHTYATADLYTVTVTIADDDSSAASTHSVTVVQPTTGLAEAIRMIDQLVAERRITRAVGTCLKATVVVAQKLIAKGNNRAAKTVLKALVSEIDFLVRIRMIRAADVAPLRALLISTYQSLR
jgi:DNA/RNA endonuclease G (NUC1)